MMNKFIISMVCVGIVGCATQKNEVMEPQVENSSQKEFERGMTALDNGQYDDAARIFDRLLVTKPATQYDLVVLYNSAAAYEGMGQCQKSLDRYREVVRSSAKKFAQIEALALFRSSLMYECLGQDTKTITALLDARKRKQHLQPEVVQAEIPARLAAAYARLGNRTRALHFFNQASQGLKGILKSEFGKKQTEVLGRTLFLMGQLNSSQRQAKSDPNTYLQSIAMQQAYLLQAIELDHELWSEKASRDLQLAYENIWLFKFTNKEHQRKFYIRALQSIKELNKLRLPEPPARARLAFENLDKVERQLQGELAKVAEITPLTPEAQKRQGLKQQGRLVDPPTPPAPKVNQR